MTRMVATRVVATRVVAAVLSVALVLGAYEWRDARTLRAVERYEHCAEDEPCWDCHTMGNHLCGPTTTDQWAVPTQQ